MPEFMFRVTCRRYAAADENGDYMGSYPEVELQSYKVIKRTPKGAWISTPLGGKSWVGLEHRKAFARLKVEDAIKDCRIRKEREIAGHKARLNAAERDLQVIDLQSARISRSAQRILEEAERDQ